MDDSACFSRRGVLEWSHGGNSGQWSGGTGNGLERESAQAPGGGACGSCFSFGGHPPVPTALVGGANRVGSVFSIASAPVLAITPCQTQRYFDSDEHRRSVYFVIRQRRSARYGLEYPSSYGRRDPRVEYSGQRRRQRAEVLPVGFLNLIKGFIME
jgi:hypothetical protein